MEVTGVCKHSETLEKLVIYKEGKNIWARPEDMFKEKVIINGKSVSRFKYIK